MYVYNYESDDDKRKLSLAHWPSLFNYNEIVVIDKHDILTPSKISWTDFRNNFCNIVGLYLSKSGCQFLDET